MHNGYMLDRIHGGSYAASNTCRGLCESTRLCQTVGCRMEVGFLMGGLLVIAAPVVVLRRTHAWGIGPRGRANGMAKSPPPPLRRRRRKGFHTTAPARRRGEGVVAGSSGGASIYPTRAPCFNIPCRRDMLYGTTC